MVLFSEHFFYAEQHGDFFYICLQVENDAVVALTLRKGFVLL